MYLLIILLPLLASLASGFFGRKIGVNGAHFVNTISITLTTILCILVFFEVGFNSISVYIKLIKWIDSESFDIFWSFNFDSLTVSMLIPVLIVSCLVHMYSIGYMSHDPHNQRFFSYLSLFTFMMIILVTSDNYLLMFVGWEGVGICSYLLVSFWFTRIAANQSSISALLTNRVGDCFLTIGMFALIWSVGNIDYATVFSLAPFINENIVTIIGICLLIGAMAKSSQIGLHVWLPMAMEGPTPVSALIHAATMVTAGVYLLMRSSPLIEYSSTILLLSLWIGAFTTVFSSLIGLFQQDIKKVIAYSTMSQLGMMVIAIGLSSYNLALYHLVNHAFYKALLFLGAGSVIHAVSDNQDFRKYGGLKPFLPLTYSVMLIASLSLVAFPFMTGFYSKDFILESALGQFCFSSIAVYLIATIGAIFTALYSSKVLYLTFLANPASAKINYKNAHESDIFMTIPLIILAVFSIYFGYITRDLFIGLGFDLYADNALFVHPNHEAVIDTEFAVPTIFKLLPLIFTITSILIAFILYEFHSSLLLLFKFNRLGYNIFSLFNQRFYIELFYNKYITDFVLKIGNYTTKVLDKGSVELIGPFGLQKLLLFVSNTISNLKIKSVTTFALYILIFAVSYAAIFYIVNSNLLMIIIFATSSLIYFSYYSNSFIITSTYYNKTLSNSFIFVKKSKLKNLLSHILLLAPLVILIIAGRIFLILLGFDRLTIIMFFTPLCSAILYIYTMNIASTDIRQFNLKNIVIVVAFSLIIALAYSAFIFLVNLYIWEYIASFFVVFFSNMEILQKVFCHLCHMPFYATSGTCTRVEESLISRLNEAITLSMADNSGRQSGSGEGSSGQGGRGQGSGPPSGPPFGSGQADRPTQGQPGIVYDPITPQNLYGIALERVRNGTITHSEQVIDVFKMPNETREEGIARLRWEHNRLIDTVPFPNEKPITSHNCFLGARREIKGILTQDAKTGRTRP